MCGRHGWLTKGIITLIVGLLAYILMPSGPTSTASYFRGRNGWFTEREEKIMVNRIIREDPSKSSMHNREPLTPALLWQSVKDYDLWPIYILGLLFQTPMATPAAYLTLSLKGLGFDTFKTNLLVIPSKVLHVVTCTFFLILWHNRNWYGHSAWSNICWRSSWWTQSHCSTWTVVGFPILGLYQPGRHQQHQQMDIMGSHDSLTLLPKR